MTELLWACEPFATVDDFTVCECDCEIDFTNDEHVALVEAALAAASDQLALLSGHELRGICAETVTVCLDGCGCRDICGCGWNPIMLPGTPIQDICDITWDGYTFNPDDFVIVDGIGVAIGRNGVTTRWPHSKLIDITHTYGHRIDETARKASLELACPAVRTCITTARSLGQGVETVSREGIMISRRSVSATADVAERAASDNPWLAQFLTLYNPTRSSFPASVYSPDLDSVHVIRAV